MHFASTLVLCCDAPARTSISASSARMIRCMGASCKPPGSLSAPGDHQVETTLTSRSGHILLCRNRGRHSSRHRGRSIVCTWVRSIVCTWHHHRGHNSSSQQSHSRRMSCINWSAPPAPEIHTNTVLMASQAPEILVNHMKDALKMTSKQVQMTVKGHPAEVDKALSAIRMAVNVTSVKEVNPYAPASLIVPVLPEHVETIRQVMLDVAWWW